MNSVLPLMLSLARPASVSNLASIAGQVRAVDVVGGLQVVLLGDTSVAEADGPEQEHDDGEANRGKRGQFDQTFHIKSPFRFLPQDAELVYYLFNLGSMLNTPPDATAGSKQGIGRPTSSNFRTCSSGNYDRNCARLATLDRLAPPTKLSCPSEDREDEVSRSG